MNALRSPSFVADGDRRLEPVEGWPELEIDFVVGVAVAPDGTIYVAHRGERPVLALRPDGTVAGEIGSGLHRPSVAYDRRGPVPIPIATRYWMHGLHLDPFGNLWITDVGRHLVMRFDAKGRLTLRLGIDGEPGCDERRFDQPTQVCVMPNGEFFVTDGYGNSRVVKFSAEGRYVREWGRRGTAPGAFHTPHTAIAGDDGRIYVADRENDRIQVFDAEGRVVEVWPELHSIDGLAWFDRRLYGSCGVDGAIVQLDAGPAYRGAVWQGPGELHYPHAIAFDGEGGLLVADTGDRWSVTGRRPEERRILERAAGQRGGLRKFRLR